MYELAPLRGYLSPTLLTPPNAATRLYGGVIHSLVVSDHLLTSYGDILFSHNILIRPSATPIPLYINILRPHLSQIRTFKNAPSRPHLAILYQSIIYPLVNFLVRFFRVRFCALLDNQQLTTPLCKVYFPRFFGISPHLSEICNKLKPQKYE